MKWIGQHIYDLISRFRADVYVEKGIRDKDGQLGSNGQVLSSTGTQVNWIAATPAGIESVSGTENRISSSGGSTPVIDAITGAVSSSSTNLATGSQIQTAINTAVATIPSGLSYQGTWNASTNSPTLASGTGVPGYYYVVSVTGTTNLDGISDWKVGDWAIFTDSGSDHWQKIDQTEGDTLQSVTTRGNTTTNSINIGSATSPVKKLTVTTSATNDGILGITTDGKNFFQAINSNSTTFPVGTLLLYYGTTVTSNITSLSNEMRISGGYTTGGKIVFRTATTERMRLTDTGLGIGTTSPTDKLVVEDATAPNIRMYRSGTGQVWQQTIDSSGRYMLREAASAGGTKYTRLQIDDTGEVEVFNTLTGTTATFSGTSDGFISLNSTDNGSVFMNFKRSGSRSAFIGYGSNSNDFSIATETSSGNTLFLTNSSERARITSGGNLLIGTTTDGGAKLQVTSNLNQQHLYIQGGYAEGVGALAQIKTTANGNALLVESATLSDSREIFEVKNSNGTVFKVQGDGAATFSGGATFGSNINIPAYIYHVGNAQSYIGWSANNTFRIATGSVSRVTVVDSYTSISNDLVLDEKLKIYNGGNYWSIFTDTNGKLEFQQNGTLRLEASSGEFDFKVPILGTTATFSGQVTIPATPVATTDAASKSYVDAHGGGLGPFLPLSAGSTKPLTGSLYLSGSAGYIVGGDGEILAGQDSGGYYLFTGFSPSVAKPVFFGDNNTYIRFNSGGSEKMRLTSGGNIGIGTSSPSYKLDVSGDGYFNGQVIVKSQGVGNSITIIESSSGNNAAYMGESAVGHGFLALFEKSVGEVIRFDANGNSFINRGNLGVGTTSPTAPLDVRRSDASGIVAEFHNSTGYGIDIGTSTSDAYISSGYAQSFIFKTNPGSGQIERARITSSGNFGIGTTSPSNFNSNARNLVVNSSGNTGITIATTSLTSNSSLIFADGTGGTAGYRGAIRYKHNGDFMQFDVAAAEKMRLDSNGRLGIGNSNPLFKLQVSGSVALDVMPTHQSEGIIRIGRYDANTSRYNDIKSYVSSTAASNYLKFSVHNGTENSVTDVLTLNGDNSATFAGVVKPSGNGSKDLGGASNRWATVYTSNISTSTSSTFAGDLVLDDHIDASPNLYFYNQANNYARLQFSTGNDLLFKINTSTELTLNGTSASFAGALNTPSTFNFTGNNGYIKVGTTWNSGVLNFLNGATTYLQFDVPNGRIKNNLGKYLTASGNTAQFGSIDNYSVAFVSNSSTKMTLLNTGKFGINTTTPQANFFEVYHGTADNTYSSFAGGISNGEYSGIHFGYSETGNNNYRKSMIVFERLDSGFGDARGDIHILNQSGGDSSSATLSDKKLSISAAGKITFHAYSGTGNIGALTYLLGVDANGNMAKITPGGPGSAVYLPLAGGTMTGTFGMSGGDAGILAKTFNSDHSDIEQLRISHADTHVDFNNNRGDVRFYTSGNIRMTIGTNVTLTGGITTGASSDFAGLNMTAAIAMGTSKITGLGDPTSNQDAATKAYVDSQVDTVDTLQEVTVNGATSDQAISLSSLLTTSAGIAFDDGSVTAPSLKLISDTNTGFYKVAADVLGIAAGGNESAVFGNRYVSIGDSAGASINLKRNNANYINADNGSGYLVFRTNGSTTSMTLNSSSATFAGEILNEMATPKIRLKPTTQNNASTIELGVLNGSTNAYAKIEAINLFNYDSNLRFYTNPIGSTTQTLALTLNSSQNAIFGGKIGIGGTPTYDIDIANNNGRIRVLGSTGYVALDLQNNSQSFYVAREGSTGGNFATGNTAYGGILAVQGNYNLQFATNGVVRQTIDGSGNATFTGTVSAEDNIYLTDAGTVRAKLLLNASDRDNVELRAESLGSTMKFFTVGTEALGLDASQNATFAGSVTAAGTATATSFISSTDSGININGLTMTRVAANSAIRVSNGLETLGLLRSYAGLNIATTGIFGGSITTNLSSEGTYFTGGSGGVRQLSITSGTNTSAHALHTFNIASSNGKYEFDVNGTTELSLDSSSATFTGDIINSQASPARNITIAGGANITANNQLTINASGSYLQLKSLTNNNYYDAALSHIFRGGSGFVENMRLTSGGNLGVGTSSPNEKIHAAGNIHAYAANGIDAGLFASTAAGSTTVAIRSSGITHFNGGNVGVGIASPVSKLHVYENTSSGNDGAAGITVEQDGTADAIVQYLLTGTRRWVTGIDNSDSDKFKIASSADLGTDTKFTLDTSGKLTLAGYSGTAQTATPTYLLGTDVNGIVVKLLSTGPGSGVYLPLAGGSMTGALQFQRGDAQELFKSINTSQSNAVQFSISHADANVAINNQRGDLQLKTAGTTKLTIAAENSTFSNALVGTAATFTGMLTGASAVFSGNLTVNGTTTTVNTQNLDVKDNNITVNYSTGDSSSTANGAGFTIQDAVNSTTNATMLWDATNDKFDFSHRITSPSLQVEGDAFFGSSSKASATYLTIDSDANNIAGIKVNRGGLTKWILYNPSGTNNFKIYDNSGGASLTMEVGGAATFSGTVKTQNAILLQRPGVTAAVAQLEMTGSGLRVIGSTGYHPLIVVQSNLSETMRVNNSGNVLIGNTTDNSGKLQVTHNTNCVAKFTNTATSMSNSTYTLMVDSSSHNSNMTAAGAFNVEVNSGNAFTIAGNGNATFGGSLTIPDYINHTSDSGTKFGFSDDDTFVVRTGGAVRLTVNDTTATFAGDVNVGGFTDSGTTALNLRAGGEHDTKLGLFESSENYGFSLNYDGGDNKLYLKRHDNSAGGTAVLTFQRYNDNAAFTGTVTASSYFLGSSSEISLATTGAGSVFLRPNGQSTSGQMQLASSGNATFAGNVTATNILAVAGAATGSPYLHFTQGGSQKAYIQYVDSGDSFELQSDNQFVVRTGGSTTAFIINSSQNATFRGNVDFLNNKGLTWAGSHSVRVESNVLKLNASGGINLQSAVTATSATFSGNISVTGSASLAGVSASNVTTPLIQLQGDLNILNKAQTAYLTLADRDTSGSEVVYNLANLGTATFAGVVDLRGSGSGYNAIRLVNNTTANNNKQTGITTLNYVGNNVSIMQYATNSGANTVYYGSADGGHSGLQNHRFYVNAGPNTPGSGHTQALHIASNTNATFAGKVGVGTSSPLTKLDVNGACIAGGKLTYRKSAGSLNTTGYAVAGLKYWANGNGQSGNFTFTCGGGANAYQKIVYSVFNAGGTWSFGKVIDEGTNHYDVTAAIVAVTGVVTFTFKIRSSGTQSYTPQVLVEFIGSNITNSINLDYAL